MKNKRVYLFLILVVIIVAAVVFWRTSLAVKPKSVVSDVVSVLPAFSLDDSMSGCRVTRSDVVTGKFLLNVWATWCLACAAEHEFLHKLEGEGVRIVGLNYRDSITPVQKWFARLGNPYVMNLMDVKAVLGEQLPVVGAPETYLIDSKGIIHHKHRGILNQKKWDSHLARIYADME